MSRSAGQGKIRGQEDGQESFVFFAAVSREHGDMPLTIQQNKVCA